MAAAIAIGSMVPVGGVDAAESDGGFPTTYRTDIPPIQPNSVEAYGLGLQWTFVTGLEWEPEMSAGLAFRSPFEGRIVISAGNAMAPVRLPAGSEIHQICFVVSDDFSASMWSKLSLHVVESADDDVSNLQFLELGSTGTTLEEFPGWTQRCITYPEPVIIKSWGDIDDDGTEHYLAYHLRAEKTGSSSMGIHTAVITWNRTISPPPATATFTDVPVGSFGFKHVEALAASGITAGCGGGNFCPNNTLTRVEMAIFLAKAMGLHWPGIN